jgi:hypothetical protein
MALLVSNDTYTRKILDPDDGTEYKATYRHLSGFERNRINAMRGDDEGGAELDLGHMMARAIELAVVAWTFPFEKTWENIIRLHGDVFGRLYLYVSLDGKEPPELEEDAAVPLAPSPPATPPGEPSDESV